VDQGSIIACLPSHVSYIGFHQVSLGNGFPSLSIGIVFQQTWSGNPLNIIYEITSSSS